MERVIVCNVPHICLFAKQHIKAGQELRYDYGDVKNMPWRAKVILLKSMIFILTQTMFISLKVYFACEGGIKQEMYCISLRQT